MGKTKKITWTEYKNERGTWPKFQQGGCIALLALAVVTCEQRLEEC